METGKRVNRGSNALLIGSSVSPFNYTTHGEKVQLPFAGG